MRRLAAVSIVLIMVFLLAACNLPVAQPVVELQQREVVNSIASLTPFQPLPTVTLTPTPELQGLWLDPAVPESLRAGLALPEGMALAVSADRAESRLEPTRDANAPVKWFYVLAAPFETITDDVSSSDFLDYWRGENDDLFDGAPLAVTQATLYAFEFLWGPVGTANMRIAIDYSELTHLRDEEKAWALLPFDLLEPEWKVISIDGQNPLLRGMEEDAYPLKVLFMLHGLHAEEAMQHPLTNRDEDKLTVLVMTGVTALVRATAATMDLKGVEYPASSILDWLTSADLAHTSNEVSFSQSCPRASYSDTSLQMCSQPEYLRLLTEAGFDIIELSGNHLNDYGREPLAYTLDLYDQVGLQYFAGGGNLQEARQPLLIEDHGNRLAFLGCNPAGPPNVWATETLPGAAPCEDYAWIKAEAQRLRNDGYLPIVTLQYYEAYRPEPLDWEQRDFRALAESGAVIISGSQAHYPMGLEFHHGVLIHYGLGNLFFDQMRYTLPNGNITDWTAREFIDRHIFYDGRYISTQLLTARLEEYARPCPMTNEERAEMLRTIFSASGW